MLIKRPFGTRDILPETSGHWQYLEDTIRQICKESAYLEIRTPVFEHTELFLRGIGETTDIVEKEMYTFNQAGEKSLTLRPENTASTVRAYLENKLYGNLAAPLKLYYIGPMFRHDRPQAGRYRQFHQFGAEAVGVKEPLLDAEIISIAILFFQRIGLKDLTLYLNSVGCSKCRPAYRLKLEDFFRDKLEKLCRHCQGRFERNPMRILDCKTEQCVLISNNAPQMKEHLCEECAGHFQRLQGLLSAGGIDFSINSRLVRGLDYYTKTAFEIQYASLGAQSAVCGGGRYDGLIEECGGEPTPGIGFAIGLERVLLALEKQELLPKIDNSIKVFVAPLTEEAQAAAFKIVSDLRKVKISSEMDYISRGLKAQIRQANKYSAKYIALIGEDELKSESVMLKNLETSAQKLVKIAGLQTELLNEMGESLNG